MTSHHLEEWDCVCWTTPNINGSFWFFWILSVAFWGKNLLTLTSCKRKLSFSRGKWDVQQISFWSAQRRQKSQWTHLTNRCFVSPHLSSPVFSEVVLVPSFQYLGLVSFLFSPPVLFSGLLCLFKLVCSLKPWTETLPAIESSLFFCHSVTGNTCEFECQSAKSSLWQ